MVLLLKDEQALRQTHMQHKKLAKQSLFINHELNKVGFHAFRFYNSR